MEILIIAKYPPIQGGVSAQVFWVSHELAGHGHNVHIVTNANEVEANFKLVTPLSVNADAISCVATGNITIYESVQLKDNTHIPYANPYSSKLFGIGLQVLQNRHIDVIIGWYFEPYGVVATLLGSIFKIPVILKHAGSDLARLSKHPQLKHTYKWMLGAANCVITNNHSLHVANLLNDLCLPESKGVHLFPSRIAKPFLASCEPFHAEILRNSFKSWISKLNIPARIIHRIGQLNDNSVFDSSLPTLGIYGKIGDVKGTYDLISALVQLAKDGYQFNFCAMSTGKAEELIRFYTLISQNASLAKCTSLFSPVYPNLVPRFIKLCDIVCCLERTFPIEIHAPQIVREVLALGSCLVVSKEVASKQPFYNSLADSKNCVMIENPQDHNELLLKLEHLVEDMSATRVIAKHGTYLSHTFENLLTHHNSMATAIEDLGEELSALVDIEA